MHGDAGASQATNSERAGDSSRTGSRGYESEMYFLTPDELDNFDIYEYQDQEGTRDNAREECLGHADRDYYDYESDDDEDNDEDELNPMDYDESDRRRDDSDGEAENQWRVVNNDEDANLFFPPEGNHDEDWHDFDAGRHRRLDAYEGGGGELIIVIYVLLRLTLQQIVVLKLPRSLFSLVDCTRCGTNILACMHHTSGFQMMRISKCCRLVAIL